MEKKYKPFDKVIARFRDKNWMCDLYSHYNTKINRHVTLGFPDLEDDCILPYEGNEHLVGRGDEPDEEVRLEEGEWVVYIIGEDDFKKWAIGRFDSLDNPITGERKFQMKPISERAGFYCVSEKVIKFSDFNPNDMEATKKHILCVKNGRIVRYKG